MLAAVTKYKDSYDGFVDLSKEIMKGRNSKQQRETVAGVLESLLPAEAAVRFRQWFPLSQVGICGLLGSFWLRFIPKSRVIDGFFSVGFWQLFPLSQVAACGLLGSRCFGSYQIEGVTVGQRVTEGQGEKLLTRWSRFTPGPRTGNTLIVLL